MKEFVFALILMIAADMVDAANVTNETDCRPTPGFETCATNSTCVRAADNRDYCMPLKCLFEKSKEVFLSQDFAEQFDDMTDALTSNPLAIFQEEDLAEMAAEVINPVLGEIWINASLGCFAYDDDEGNRLLKLVADGGLSFVIGASFEAEFFGSFQPSIFGAFDTSKVVGYFGEICRGAGASAEIGAEPFFGVHFTTVDGIGGSSTSVNFDVAIAPIQVAGTVAIAPGIRSLDEPQVPSVTWSPLAAGYGGGISLLRCNTVRAFRP